MTPSESLPGLAQDSLSPRHETHPEEATREHLWERELHLGQGRRAEGWGRAAGDRTRLWSATQCQQNASAVGLLGGFKMGLKRSVENDYEKH